MALHNASDLVAGTIVAQNYLAQAAVLAKSFCDTHPQGLFTTLVLDASPGMQLPDGMKGLIITIDDLPIDREVLFRMVASYSVMELATALKPVFLKYLLSIHGNRVIYLDPDIFVYSALTEVFENLNRSPIVLTPHTLEPIPRDGLETSEETLRHSGIFNLGFIGVNSDGATFLDWWQERLISDAVVDLPRALFTDQRWIDFVPSLFQYRNLTDPGLNVAYWNVHERSLVWSPSGEVLVNGSPLKFIHFSGYDPEHPHRISKHTSNRERFTLGDSSVLRVLFDEYGLRLSSLGHANRKKTPYRFDYSPIGLPLNSFSRAAYRRGLSGAETPLQKADPPNPFLEPTEFEKWLCEPNRGLPGFRHSRLDAEIWRQRPDLQKLFPDINCDNSVQFFNWLHEDPIAQAIRLPFGISYSCQNMPSQSQRGGWNVVGYFSAELGVGEAGRQLARLISLCGRPVEYVGAMAELSRQAHEFPYPITQTPRYERSLIAVNADQLDRALKLSGLAQLPRRTRVGFWFWELERFPKIWDRQFSNVDEVWCCTDFIAESLRQAAQKKTVRKIRLPIEKPAEPTPFTRRLVSLPEGFVFLFTFDFNSVAKRKNPLGVIEAYKTAFSPHEGARLVLKSINGHHQREELARIQYAIQSRPDITIVDGYVSAAEVQAQIELSDCFVSLHRAEGYGLNLAAAMAAEKPVIATGYSGNLEFMPTNYPFLVDYRLVEVGDGAAPYDPTAIWAEPNLETASERMRYVFSNRAEAGRAAERHAHELLTRFSTERCVNELLQVLENVE